MSSATSIDRAPANDVAGKSSAPAARQDTFQPWHFFVLVSLLAATVAVVMARESRPEHLVLISLTIGAAGFAGAALYRTLVPLVRTDLRSLDGPMTESLRGVLEREKMLVLRAIKDLEFDRAMGKVSAGDFEEMAGRLRARAMALMRQLDSGAGYRELIERELNMRLLNRRARKSPAGEPVDHAEAGAPRPAPATCACGTTNDVDAAFCKRCGTRLAASPVS